MEFMLVTLLLFVLIAFIDEFFVHMHTFGLIPIKCEYKE